MSIIRWIVGRILLLLNVIFSPSSAKLTREQTAELEKATAHLSLYHLPACPFCLKVRRAMKRQGLVLNLRNINENSAFKDELIKEGGKRTVPCLRIEKENEPVQWLYESNDIIDYIAQFKV